MASAVGTAVEITIEIEGVPASSFLHIFEPRSLRGRRGGGGRGGGRGGGTVFERFSAKKPGPWGLLIRGRAAPMKQRSALAFPVRGYGPRGYGRRPRGRGALSGRELPRVGGPAGARLARGGRGRSRAPGGRPRSQGGGAAGAAALRGRRRAARPRGGRGALRRPGRGGGPPPRGPPPPRGRGESRPARRRARIVARAEGETPQS